MSWRKIVLTFFSSQIETEADYEKALIRASKDPNDPRTKGTKGPRVYKPTQAAQKPTQEATKPAAKKPSLKNIQR